jgi:hypothetical protein
MDQLWGVLGRAYIDTVFRDNVIKYVKADATDPKKPESDVSKLVDLHAYLAREGFRTSRYERGEINRIFLICKLNAGEPDPTNPLKAMVQVSRVATNVFARPELPALPTRPAELWSLIGLCAVDDDVRVRYTAIGANVTLEATKAPPFFVSAAEIVVASLLFADQDTNGGLMVFAPTCWIPPANETAILEELKAVIDQLVAGTITLPMVHCGAGYTLSSASSAKRNYQHLDSPFAERLQAALVDAKRRAAEKAA